MGMVRSRSDAGCATNRRPGAAQSVMLWSMTTMRTLPRRLLILFVLSLGLAVPASASATSYCVFPATGCAVSEPSVTSALSAASSDPGSASDTIYLGNQSYSEASLQYTGAATLAITGTGTSSALTSPTTGGTVLFLSGPGVVTLQGFQIQLPSGSNPRGVWANGSGSGLTVSSLLITSDPSASNAAGILALVPTTVSGSSITVPPTPNATAIYVGTSTLTVTDSRLTGSGIQLNGSGSVTAHRLTITLGAGGAGISGNVGAGIASSSIDDSLILLQANNTSAVIPAGTTGTWQAEVRHVTIVGDGTPGEFAFYAASSGGAIAVAAHDSIARGVSASVTTSGAGAAVTADHSDFPGSTTASSGYTPGPGNVDVDPQFVGGSDFHLLPTSPVLNADSTPQQAGESSTDRDGLPRFGFSPRDMGAYQHQPPTITSASASPSSTTAGMPVTHSVTASDPDPADALSYAWAFDDGTGAAGATVTHAYSTAGTHVATVTVTDATGLRATTTVSVTVGARPAPPPRNPPPPDVEHFAVSPATFAPASAATAFAGAAAVHRGTRFSFDIDAPASVTIAFTRLVPGVRRNGRCQDPPARRRKRAHLRACTRRVGAGHLNRSVPGAGHYSIPFTGRVSGSAPLPLGAYSATLSASNATGAAVPRSVRFKLVSAKPPHRPRRRHRRR